MREEQSDPFLSAGGSGNGVSGLAAVSPPSLLARQLLKPHPGPAEAAILAQQCVF